ncbi:hypothetical protein [Bradyrhizobium jicamae]|uniref:hypothetical protein n=1 Tax=Bradyrhizobium jicamae TaxID=280332 RepID=UPI0020137111|nr:hypothetical protein [Bradyrhizobium jicamae]
MFKALIAGAVAVGLVVAPTAASAMTTHKVHHVQKHKMAPGTTTGMSKETTTDKMTTGSTTKSTTGTTTGNAAKSTTGTTSGTATKKNY